MNIGVIGCLLLGGTFFVFGLIFAVMKEKGAVLVSGFNSFSKSERANYDQQAISRDMGNSLFLWSSLFVVGAILCYFVSEYIAILVFIIWLIMFMREVHLDNEKAFSKYKLMNQEGKNNE